MIQHDPAVYLLELAGAPAIRLLQESSRTAVCCESLFLHSRRGVEVNCGSTKLGYGEKEPCKIALVLIYIYICISGIL